MSARLDEVAVAPWLHSRQGMTKPTTTKLPLRSQTLRVLTNDALATAAGGILMRDTVIIPTSRIVSAPVEPLR